MKCSHGAGTALVLVALILGAAVAEPAARAASNFLRVTVDAFEVVVVVVAASLSLAALAVLMYFTAWLRQRYIQRIAAPQVPKPLSVIQVSAEVVPSEPSPTAGLAELRSALPLLTGQGARAPQEIPS